MIRYLTCGLGLTLACCLSGCARYQSFRVLDAQSGKPIDGVQAERLEGDLKLSRMPFVLLDSVSPVERQNSDASGTVKFKKAGQKFAFNLQSGMPGFDRAYVVGSGSGVKIVYPDERREVHVKPVDGVVEIPLHRSHGSAAQAAKPAKGKLLLSDSSTVQTGFARPMK